MFGKISDEMSKSCQTRTVQFSFTCFHLVRFFEVVGWSEFFVNCGRCYYIIVGGKKSVVEPPLQSERKEYMN